jgi:tagatose 1,6-diphosphate aldolase GatY/KbaY
MEQIREAVSEAYTSIMVDGSLLPFITNVQLTRAAADAAHEAGKGAEAELGKTAGEEDWSSGEPADRTMTDPDAAAEFVRLTGIDALAVSIGNAHGNYSATPELDLRRLADIAKQVAVPLVLHGASGIPAMDLRRAVELGVAKVNFNTELREAYFGAVERFGASRELRLLDLMEACTAAIQSVMEAKMLLLSGNA